MSDSEEMLNYGKMPWSGPQHRGVEEGRGKIKRNMQTYRPQLVQDRVESLTRKAK